MHPVLLFFPAGVPAELERIARIENLDPQWLALLLWQMQKQLSWRVLAEPDDAPGSFVVPMHHDVLKAIRRDYASYMRALRKHSVITLWVEYLARSHSRRFKYHDRFDLGGNQDRYHLIKKTVINAFNRPHQKPADEWMAKRLDYLRAFDIESQLALAWARKIAPTKKRPSLWLSNVEHNVTIFSQGNRRLTKDRYGREHTNLTNLPRHIRQSYVRHKGQPLLELDIPSSQPHMLYLVLLQANKCQQDMPKFQQALEQDFYIVLATKAGKTRHDMKLDVIRYLFAKTYQNKTSRLVEQEFPQVHRAVCQVKAKGGHECLSQHLQRIESKIVFDVCQELHMGGQEPFYTVHDSIGCLHTHVTKTEQVFLSRLVQAGLHWIQSLR